MPGIPWVRTLALLTRFWEPGFNGSLQAATVAELPELDGAQIATATLHHREHGAIPHLLASHKRAEVSQREVQGRQ